MVKFEELFINFALGTLLIVSIFAFGISLQADNNASESITDNALLNSSFGQLQEDLGGMRDKTQTQRELFEEETPTTGFGSLILFSIVSSGKVFTGVIAGTFNVLIKLPIVLFGVDPIVSAVLSSILGVMIIFGLWFVYKLGG